MPKIKFTKGELKRQRDALRQYEHYLPILQLKKQQLQIEILSWLNAQEDRRKQQAARRKSVERWLGLLADPGVDVKPLVVIDRVVAGAKNVAGTEIPVFERVDFKPVDYDLFEFPLWVDGAVEALKLFAALREEIRIIEEGVALLRQELRVTSQRVNLFEKVKIPEAEEAIRLIKITIGDQMANAVGRSKIAKRKIQEAELAGAAA
jgi:V/A-type H+-transporting ATPase subunit D